MRQAFFVFSKSYSSNIDEIVPPEALPEMPKNEKPTLSKRDNLLMALKYLMCTAGAGIIQFVSFTLLNAAAHFDRLPVFLKLFPGAAVTELKYGPSYFVALALSVIFNFTANRKYTFRSANNRAPSPWRRCSGTILCSRRFLSGGARRSRSTAGMNLRSSCRRCSSTPLRNFSSIASSYSATRSTPP